MVNVTFSIYRYIREIKNIVHDNISLEVDDVVDFMVEEVVFESTRIVFPMIHEAKQDND